MTSLSGFVLRQCSFRYLPISNHFSVPEDVSLLGAGQPGLAVGARQRHPVQGGEEGEEASEGEEGERRRVQRQGLCGGQAGAFLFGVFSQLDLKVSSVLTELG